MIKITMILLALSVGFSQTIYLVSEAKQASSSTIQNSRFKISPIEQGRLQPVRPR
jgi:hypothetical protein